MHRFLFLLALFGLFNVEAYGQGMTLPDDESAFCSIIANGNAAYRTLDHERALADQNQNAIRAQQIEQKMREAFLKRNADIFALSGQKGFSVNNWLVTVMNIMSPLPDCYSTVASCTYVDVRPACSPITQLRTVTPTTPALLQYFGTKQKGDQLTMTGTFVRQFADVGAGSPGVPRSPDGFVESSTDAQAMLQPVYSVLVRQWR